MTFSVLVIFNYVIPKTSVETQNMFTEYILVNEVKKFEVLANDNGKF